MTCLLRLSTAILVAAALLQVGCGERSFANENDLLRARVLDLEQDLGDLKQRNAELEAELARASGQPDSLPEEIRAATPRVVGIDIDRRSHARDEDGDGENDTLVIYVRPRDGLGRFVQLVGELSVHAALLPASEIAHTIGQVELSPGELRAAYRSGVIGTHYTIELPVEFPPDADECDVRAAFTDGITGLRHEAHQSIELR